MRIRQGVFLLCFLYFLLAIYPMGVYNDDGRYKVCYEMYRERYRVMENADNKKQEPCPKCCCERTTERSEKEYKDLINKVLLANHIKGCVTRDIKEGKEETVDELVKLLQKLMK